MWIEAATAWKWPCETKVVCVECSSSSDTRREKTKD